MKLRVRKMIYCKNCFGQHTAECFLEAAEYVEHAPENMFSPLVREERQRMVASLRYMAQSPDKPEFQKTRNVLPWLVGGVSSML